MNDGADTARIPGPRGHLIMGSLAEFRSGMLDFFTRLKNDYGPIARFRLGPRKLILVNEPSLIEEVLVAQNKCFKKHYGVRLLKPVLGNGLLLSEGKLWLRQRRLVQPSFSRRFMQEFAEIVQHHVSRLADKWRTMPRRDLYVDMTQLTVQIAAHAFLGVSNTKQTEEIGDFLEVIHTDFEYRFQRAWNVPYWIPTARNRKLRGAVQRLTNIIDEMIECRETDFEDRHDALSLLLAAKDESGHKMPRKLLRDEVMTLLLAGHDTTANGLTWTWSLLAQNPQAMRQTKDEADKWSISNNDFSPDSNDLVYTRSVIKESMRLFPPVYLFGREATKSVRVGDYLIRKGESVVMSQWVVQRDRRFFPDPESFKPERWTTEFERSLPKYAYFPFGGGPRVCLGKDVAMVEASIILANLAGTFGLALEDPDNLTPWPTVTLRPRDAVWAQVTAHDDEIADSTTHKQQTQRSHS